MPAGNFRTGQPSGIDFTLVTVLFLVIVYSILVKFLLRPCQETPTEQLLTKRTVAKQERMDYIRPGLRTFAPPPFFNTTMKQKNRLELRIRGELAAGRNKQTIFRSLSKDHDRAEVLYHLNNLPDKKSLRRYFWPGRLLCLLLLVITVKKLYDMALVQLAAAAVHQFSPLLFLDLIVPAINFYILTKLWRFERQGYLFMAILGVLALVRPENRVQPDLWIYLAIIALSLFLFRKLFPKQTRLRPTE